MCIMAPTIKPQHQCPNCGTCPSCGRGGYQQPYIQPGPRTHPTHPYPTHPAPITITPGPIWIIPGTTITGGSQVTRAYITTTP